MILEPTVSARTCLKLKWVRDPGRGDWVRTSDFYVPNVALYQAELHPVARHFISIPPACQFFRRKAVLPKPQGLTTRGCRGAPVVKGSIGIAQTGPWMPSVATIADAARKPAKRAGLVRYLSGGRRAPDHYVLISALSGSKLSLRFKLKSRRVKSDGGKR